MNKKLPNRLFRREAQNRPEEVDQVQRGAVSRGPDGGEEVGGGSGLRGAGGGSEQHRGRPAERAFRALHTFGFVKLLKV